MWRAQWPMSRCAWANSFHGSLFEFNKNSAFYSRNFFYPIVPPVRCAARTNRAEQASKTTTFSAPVGLTFGSVGPSVVPRTRLHGLGYIHLSQAPGAGRDKLGSSIRDLQYDQIHRISPIRERRGCIGSSTFGVVTTTIAGDYRGVQMGAKLTF